MRCFFLILISASIFCLGGCGASEPAASDQGSEATPAAPTQDSSGPPALKAPPP